MATESQSDRIERKLDALLILAAETNQTVGYERRKLQTMSQNIDDAFAHANDVATANGDTEQAAAALLSELSQMLHDAANGADVVTAVNAIADRLEAQKNDLAQAVVTNTPAAPTPPSP